VLSIMTRSEYDRLMGLAAALWAAGPSPKQVEAWWWELQHFTLADGEDALRRLARSHEKLPSLATLIAETKNVRNRRPRQPRIVHVWGEQERERLIRFGKVIQEASAAGRLDVVQKAMDEALHSAPPVDPLIAAEEALQPTTSIA
jgi:hypothetical protein